MHKNWIWAESWKSVVTMTLVVMETVYSAEHCFDWWWCQSEAPSNVMNIQNHNPPTLCVWARTWHFSLLKTLVKDCLKVKYAAAAHYLYNSQNTQKDSIKYWWLCYCVRAADVHHHPPRCFVAACSAGLQKIVKKCSGRNTTVNLQDPQQTHKRQGHFLWAPKEAVQIEIEYWINHS